METKLESVLTTSMKSATLSYIEDHPESKEELISLTISNKQPYAWKAAWYLGYLLKKTTLKSYNMLKPYSKFCRKEMKANKENY